MTSRFWNNTDVQLQSLLNGMNKFEKWNVKLKRFMWTHVNIELKGLLLLNSLNLIQGIIIIFLM